MSKFDVAVQCEENPITEQDIREWNEFLEAAMADEPPKFLGMITEYTLQLPPELTRHNEQCSKEAVTFRKNDYDFRTHRHYDEMECGQCRIIWRESV